MVSSLSIRSAFSYPALSPRKVRDVFIVGAGCIGQSLAASLLKSDAANRVFLMGKAAHLPGLQERGIRVQGALDATFNTNRQFVITDRVCERFVLKYHIQTQPFVFLSTKACDATSSIASLQGALQRPKVICLQNGLGIEQEIERHFPSLKGRVLKGHVFGAAHKKGDTLFAYRGKIIVGTNDPEECRDLRAIFATPDTSIFNLELSPNILHAIYPKIAVNCVCNPLTVIFNQNIGSIRAAYESLIRKICHEVYLVGVSYGIDLKSSVVLADLVLETMSRFSSHYSSSYLDHRAGKITEIEYINGAIVKMARKNNINVPLNQYLLTVMKEIEGKRALFTTVDEFYRFEASYLETIRTQLLGVKHVP